MQRAKLIRRLANYMRTEHMHVRAKPVSFLCSIHSPARKLLTNVRFAHIEMPNQIAHITHSAFET